MTDESEISKAARDAFTYGTGFMRDGKHVPMENVYMSAKDAATEDLVKWARACANGCATMKSKSGDYGLFDDLADRIEVLEEALRLADAALSGANMNMDVVQKKVSAALGEKK